MAFKMTDGDKLVAEIDDLFSRLGPEELQLPDGIGANVQGIMAATELLSRAVSAEKVIEVSRRAIQMLDTLTLNCLREGYIHAKSINDETMAQVCFNNLLTMSKKTSDSVVSYPSCNSAAVTKEQALSVEQVSVNKVSNVQSQLLSSINSTGVLDNISESMEEGNRRGAQCRHYTANNTTDVAKRQGFKDVSLRRCHSPRNEEVSQRAMRTKDCSVTKENMQKQPTLGKRNVLKSNLAKEEIKILSSTLSEDYGDSDSDDLFTISSKGRQNKLTNRRPNSEDASFHDFVGSAKMNQSSHEVDYSQPSTSTGGRSKGQIHKQIESEESDSEMESKSKRPAKGKSIIGKGGKNTLSKRTNSAQLHKEINESDSEKEQAVGRGKKREYYSRIPLGKMRDTVFSDSETVSPSPKPKSKRSLSASSKLKNITGGKVSHSKESKGKKLKRTNNSKNKLPYSEKHKVIDNYEKSPSSKNLKKKRSLSAGRLDLECDTAQEIKSSSVRRKTANKKAGKCFSDSEMVSPAPKTSKLQSSTSNKTKAKNDVEKNVSNSKIKNGKTSKNTLAKANSNANDGHKPLFVKRLEELSSSVLQGTPDPLEPGKNKKAKSTNKEPGNKACISDKKSPANKTKNKEEVKVRNNKKSPGNVSKEEQVEKPIKKPPANKSKKEQVQVSKKKLGTNNNKEKGKGSNKKITQNKSGATKKVKGKQKNSNNKESIDVNSNVRENKTSEALSVKGNGGVKKNKHLVSENGEDIAEEEENDKYSDEFYSSGDESMFDSEPKLLSLRACLSSIKKKVPRQIGTATPPLRIFLSSHSAHSSVVDTDSDTNSFANVPMKIDDKNVVKRMAKANRPKDEGQPTTVIPRNKLTRTPETLRKIMKEKAKKKGSDSDSSEHLECSSFSE